MTHRQGEPFTIKNLNTIKESINQKITILGSGVGSINASYEPFYEFTPDFIDAITIQKLQDGEAIIPKDLYKNVDAVGFFDSLHDFKSDFMDCQGNIRGISNSWNYKKFGFTFLLNGGYNSLLTYPGNLIQNAYSYLNRIPRPLNQDNLENYFSIGNIYDIIENKDNLKGNIYILPNTRQTTDKSSVYNSLISLFAKYKDINFNDKIKLVFDFQLNLFDIIQAGRTKNVNNDGFCILYTAEIMTDPAPKTKAAKIDDIFGCENWYVEILNEPRSYDAQNENVRGNVNVLFNKIEISKENDLENAEFSVNVTYSNEDQNETIDVKMNSKSNTIQNIKNMIRNTIEKLTSTTDRFDYYNDSINDRIGFYNKFNTETLSKETDANNYKKKYTRYFARKRLGDTLEGRVCKKDKQQQLQFKNVIKETKSGIVRNKTSYKLSNNTINLKKDSIKDAVLVTHDRMLFSYAVINKIPTILDLQEHMILFVPPETQSGGVSGPFGNGIPEEPKNNNNNNNNNNEPPLFDNDDSIQDLSSGSSLDDNSILFESIKNNISDLIHFLYLYKDGRQILFKDNIFTNFMKNVNLQLHNQVLEYAYLGQYYNNALVISPKNELESNLREIKTEIDSLNNNPIYTRYGGLMYNNLFLYIVDNNNSSIKINKYPTQKNGSWESYINIKFMRQGGNTLEYQFYDDDINIIINKLSDESRNYNNLAKGIQTFYEEGYNEEIANKEEPINNEEISNNEETSNNEERDINRQISEFTQKNEKTILFISLIFAIMVSLQIKQFFDSMTGGAGDGSDKDVPLDEKILNSSFNFLNNKENLFEKNITIFYFLFNLLQSYETSFIGYQEGIDAFYTKIDESYILTDMIGITNYIPHNIEFYVFLKLLLKDYDEDKVNKINYALFEYYLYNLKDSNLIYSRFQDIKSYLLKTNYEIEITEEITQIIQNENKESSEYFESTMKLAKELSQQIINENYNAYQESNFEKVYENVSKYNLTLKGFTDMKTEFVTKTIDIISKMVNKDLLPEYVSQATKDSQASQDIKLINETTKIKTLDNTINEKAKGISYKKYTPLKLENNAAYGAGRRIKQYNKTTRKSMKYHKHKKTNKNNKNNKKKKSLKKSMKKTRTYKKK